MVEIWRDVKGYEGLYRVSNLGRIKSLHREEELILKQTGNHGYMHVCFSKNGKHSFKKVHRIVAEAFISNVSNYPFCGHENDCRWDNRAENLYWTTPKENTVHNGINQRKKPEKPGIRKNRKPTREEIRYAKWLDALMPGLSSFRSIELVTKQ